MAITIHIQKNIPVRNAAPKWTHTKPNNKKRANHLWAKKKIAPTSIINVKIFRIWLKGWNHLQITVIVSGSKNPSQPLVYVADKR